MPFFDYDQNNSGGHFTHNAESGIGCRVVVEAHDATHANARAEEIGLYFHGIEKGWDCECCGDRWYPSYDTCNPEDVKGGWGIPSYIHYLDGRVVEVPCEPRNA